ncbi:MAG TPA: hypothetical protein VIN10_06485 [Bacteroidales bacterium]
MKKIIALFIIIGFVNTTFSQDTEWPREREHEGSVLTIYEPQVESWEDYAKIDFRMAFSLVPYQENNEVVGVIYMQAATTVNMNTHLVTMYNLEIPKIDFPSLNQNESAAYDAIVKSFLSPDTTLQIALELIVACTPKPASEPSTVKVDNTPPVIFVSTSPAILLQLEGKPMLYSSGKNDTTLQLMINANWPVFYSTSTKDYYLFDDMEWQQTETLSGNWEFTSDLPKALKELANDTAFSDLQHAFPAPKTPNSEMPTIFYSEIPAEVMLFDGQPKYESISGTDLSYASNTESALFLDHGNQDYYYLVAGRWFSSMSLNGPWVYATDNLPSDFQKIPLDSPAAAVLASVPGTDEAADAVLIAQIPNTKIVDTKTATENLDVTYNGTPTFDAISGTSMKYAVNSPDKVIEVNNNSYYVCNDAVWFSGPSPNGPWVVAETVPQVIYSIPPSSPVYNVTYVTQVTTTSGQVQSSSTAGYMGAFVVGAAIGATIVMGTGYAYPPYYYHPPYGYPMCYPYPCTYGAYAYHPYPYYGGTANSYYNSATGAYGRSATAYSPYGSKTVAQGYNPSTGTYSRGASVSTPYGNARAAQAYNPYTGATARGASESNAYGTRGAAGAYNPSTGNAAATRQASGAYGNAGATTVSDGHGQNATTAHASNYQGSVAAGSTSGGSKAITASGQGGSGSAVKTKSGNMYAGSDGNVYKNTDGSWQQVNNSGSKPGTSPQPHNSQDDMANRNMQGSQMQSMNNDFQNRQSGSFQSQQFSQARSGGFSGGFNGGASRSFGGGGFTGGGFGGRR